MNPSSKAQTVLNVLERSDYATIGGLIEPGTRVLDLGCGNGALLAWLMENKKVAGRGIELDGSLVQQAIARGASVYQGDMAESLSDYPDSAFDYIILSQTLQQVAHPLDLLREMLRVGQRIIVGFPNFGHWSVRLTMLFGGQMPRNKLFPYEWHETPNIRMLTVNDFETLAAKEKWIVEKRIFLSGQNQITIAGNLLAEIAVFVLRK